MMSQIWLKCFILVARESLPDITKWDLSNVTNIKDMFYFCKKLISFPDISKWNTENITDMSFSVKN